MDTTLLSAPHIEYLGFAPLVALVAAALLILLLDAFSPAGRRLAPVLGLASLAAALALTARFLVQAPPDPIPGMFVADGFAHVFDLIVYLAALGAVGLSWRGQQDGARAEYYALLLTATAGMVTLGHAASLVTIFLGLELLSVVLYVLTGFLNQRERALEAAVKYFFLGAFSASFLLYGIALIYGTTGSFDLAAIGSRLGELSGRGADLVSPLVLCGVALLLCGFAFKISSVPFHMWTPDVYEGAPTPIAAFMSVATKASAFAALVRVFTTALGPVAVRWEPVVAAVAVATMLVGNLIGLTQRNLKRLLAFSSIGHAGYALIGLAAWNSGGREAILFYLLAYAFMNLGAFGIVAVLERGGEGLHSHEIAGLARRRPLLAAAMALFLLSLAGVPPTAGFVGKFNLFLSAVDAGHIGLAVAAALYSAIAAYYYLRVVVVMYMQPVPAGELGERELPRIGGPAALTLGLAALGVVYLGIAPGGVLDLLSRVVAALAGAAQGAA